MLANSTMVSQSYEHASSHATAHKKYSKAISRPVRQPPPISAEQNSHISSPEGFRKESSHRRISEQATRLIATSRRIGTLENYESI